MILIDHVFDDRYIILKIRIDRDADITEIGSGDKACGKRVLMSDIPGELYTINLVRILFMFGFNKLPGLILTSVIDKHNEAVHGDLTLIDKIVENSSQSFGAHLKDFFFVIAGYYDSKTFHLKSS